VVGSSLIISLIFLFNFIILFFSYCSS